MNRKLLLFGLLLATFGIFLYLDAGKDGLDQPSIERITLGVAARESSGLVYIADRKDYFKKHGIEVTLKEVATGLQAVEALMRNEVDIATAAEFVFVTRSPLGKDLRILSNIARANDCECIARKDRGIEEPSDLKGKRIGVVPGMQAEFFLHAFLARNGLSSKDIMQVELKPSDIMKTISEGGIDAAVTGLNTPEIKKALGSNAISWSAQGIQDYYFLLIANEEFVKTRPAAIERLLKALLDAEKLVLKNRKEAAETLETCFNLSSTEESALWNRYDYEVRLDQDLLILMEEETRWAVRKGLIPDWRPNYFMMTHLESLEKISREAVSIIH